MKPAQARFPAVPRKIVGFHLDDTREWIADLECGHQRPVRLNPPWRGPHWVTDALGRMAHTGTELDCVPCARLIERQASG